MNSTTQQHVQQWQHQVIAFINTFVLFCQILFGCTGNVLNLIVLLSRNMRSRTNLIFAVMAFADLFFLLMHIPQFLFFCVSLTVFQLVVSMMYATIERVQVFRCPFRTSRRSVSPRFLATIAFMVLGALAVTAPNFMLPSNTFPHRIVRLLLVLHAVSVVLVPLVVCALLNILLVLALKKNTMPIQMLENLQAQQKILMARNKAEQKVTIMVTAIITSFVICNAPGAILYVAHQNHITFRKVGAVTYAYNSCYLPCMNWAQKIRCCVKLDSAQAKEIYAIVLREIL
uniref:G_PROTEIN_RECEP_F1_2 domain-containing protein n=1 Tax=Angiostrongylus cantonensis TaxID=6313 RepID=A0A0K0DB27_ANGCA